MNTEHRTQDTEYRIKGFTLLEILIAIGIMAIMMLSITSVTDNITLMRSETIAHNDMRHGVTLALSKITDDLRVAVMADNKFLGADKRFITGFFGDADHVDFSTTSHVHFVKNNRDTDQVNVGYYLAKNEAGSNNLLRRQTDHLTDDVKSGGSAFVLISGVEEFDLEYYDANKKEWVKQWSTESVSTGGALPQIVRVKMTVLGEPEDPDDEDSRKKYDYEIDVPIEMYNKKISF